MGLYKKEVLIRPSSTVTVDGAKDWTKNWLNDTFQNADENKDENGNYIDYFFADVFDARDGNIYRVFSDACDSKYDMGGKLNFEILNKVEINDRMEKIDSTVELADEKIKSLENIVYQPEAVVI